MVLLQEAATPFHPKAVRAASGSLFSLPLFRGPSIKNLADLKLPHLIALDARGKDIRKFKWPSTPLLLVGEEGPGIPPELRCEKLSIPLKNNVESLNATAASAIALSHFSFSR
jgi:TrmH family RNA methyltransferase